MSSRLVPSGTVLLACLALAVGAAPASASAAQPSTPDARPAAPAQATRSVASWRGNGIGGLWMGFVLLPGQYTPQLRWKTFLDGGVMFADLPAEGLADFDQAAYRRREALAGYWQTYSFSGTSGESRRDGTPARWALRLVKPDELKIDGDTFHRCASVDGLRLDGAWTSYAAPDDPQLDQLPVGRRPVIHFGRDGRFTDDGLFAAFLTSGGDDRPGAGRYELRDFTLLLRYDDGRVRREAFSGFLKASIAQQDARIFIRRSTLSKRATR